MEITNIIQSKRDKRTFRYLKLDNELRCILVCDVEGESSACSLDVKAGSALDPGDLPGTAHFLEHMLFQGTDRYPRESEYAEFLANNSGTSNAYTS